MLVNESDRFGLDTISPRRWIHPMAHVMMIAIRDSKGKARWTTSVFEDVFEKERSSTSARACPLFAPQTSKKRLRTRFFSSLLAVAQAVIGLGTWNGGSNSTNTSRSYNLCLHRSRQSCAVDRTAHRTGPSRRSTGSYPGLFGRALVAACLPKIKIEQSRSQNNCRRGCLTTRFQKITATFLKITATSLENSIRNSKNEIFS